MISENEAFVLLSAGILEQAVSDYKDLLRGKKVTDSNGVPVGTVKSLEKFFLSPYGQLLSRNNGRAIINRCRQEVADGNHNKPKKGAGIYSKQLDYSKGVICIETGVVYSTPQKAAESIGCKKNGIFASCRYGTSIRKKHFRVVADDVTD